MWRQLLVIGCVLIIAGCKDSAPTSPANPPQPSSATTTPAGSPAAQAAVPVTPAGATAVKPRLDTCALLSPEEIQAVQGEVVKETKLSGQSSNGYSISQCFFSLPTFTNSISLMVAQKGEGADARHPREFWRSTFHDDKEQKEKREKDEAEEEESAPAEKIRGIGEEAFWLGNRVSGALYVLKGDAYVRISIGGPTDAASKRRAKALAQKAIARLWVDARVYFH